MVSIECEYGGLVPVLDASKSLGEAISEFIKKYLTVNVWTFVVHAVCAVIIMTLIAVWVWKPTNFFIEANKKKLDKERHDLVLNTRETRYFLGLLKKERNELFYLRRNTETLAREEASKIITDARLAAEETTARMRRDAEERVRVMEEKARGQIKNSVVQLSVELTEKLLCANISDENNKAIIDAYIKDLENRKLTSVSSSNPS